jgi:predicted SprT family Zn-dependent metalloprotease
MYDVTIAPENGNDLITNDIAAYDTKINLSDPTARLHGAFIVAFDFFNKHLFESRLPHCVITMRASRGSRGYFSKDRFEGPSEEISHEIALNPRASKKRTVAQVLSIVHEMVHLEQQCFYTPGRGRYHNKEWARLMKRLGLYPSSTGQPGGGETGQRVSHFIIAGGPFDIACAELLATGFKIEYADIRHDGQRKTPEKSKAKYTCNGCGFNAWAKPRATNLSCLDCGLQMVEVA